MRIGFHNIIISGLIVLFLCLTVCQPAYTQKYEIIHLGSLGGTYGRSKDINRLGQIVGESGTNDGKTHAFFWTQKTGIIDLGTLGGQYSWVSAINNLGEVVGYSYNRSGVPRCFLWTESGGMVDIGTSGGRCEAMDINDLGQVVGYYTRLKERRAFIWDRTNGMQDLNDIIPAPADWKFDTALAINNVGKVVVIGKKGVEGFLGTFFNLIWSPRDGIFKLTFTAGVSAINDLGQAVGEKIFGHGHAILWKNNMITDLGSLYKGTFPYSAELTEIADSSWARGINNLGQIVGGSWSDLDVKCSSGGPSETPGFYTTPHCSGYPHGFIWDSYHGMRDLNDLIATDSGWTIGEASAINDFGWIAGEGTLKGKVTQAILLRPIIEANRLSDDDAP